MGEPWSPERRAAFNAKRGVAVAERPEAPSPIGDREAWLMNVRAQMGEEVNSNLYADDGDSAPISPEDKGVVTHKSSGLVTMWAQTTWGWASRAVPRKDAELMLENGMRVSCGDCDGQHGPGPNDCPAREPFAYRVCPIPGCNADGAGPKRFYDLNRDQVADALPADDGAVIRDSYSDTSTPESRTLDQMNQHIRWYHEGAAYGRGLMNAQQVVSGR